MPNIRYSMPPVLSRDQCEMIVADGIRILDEIGVECRHSGIQGMVADAPGGRVQGERLHFEPKLCREQIEKIRRIVQGRKDPAREHTQKSRSETPSPGPSGHPLPKGRGFLHPHPASPHPALRATLSLTGRG